MSKKPAKESTITIVFTHTFITFKATDWDIKVDKGSGILSNSNTKKELVLMPSPNLLYIRLPLEKDDG